MLVLSSTPDWAYHCYKCGIYSKDLEITYITPPSESGKTESNNLKAICHSCNIKK